jgi:hypothetical protein
MSEQKRWRPDNWKNRHEDTVKQLKEIGVASDVIKSVELESSLFEAGADAMLEALEELTVMMLSIYNKHSEGVSVKAEVQGVHGRIIFIPDENVKEVNHVSQGR